MSISSSDLAVDGHELAHVGLPLLESEALLLGVHTIIQGISIVGVGLRARVPLVLGGSTLLCLEQEGAVLLEIEAAITICIASLEIISDLLHDLLNGSRVLFENLVLIQGLLLVLLRDVSLPELVVLGGDTAIALAHLG